MKHAIIVTGGKQYRVAEGDVIFVEKLDVEVGSAVTFDNVLAVSDKELAVGMDNSIFVKLLVKFEEGWKNV